MIIRLRVMQAMGCLPPSSDHPHRYIDWTIVRFFSDVAVVIGNVWWSGAVTVKSGQMLYTTVLEVVRKNR